MRDFHCQSILWLEENYKLGFVLLSHSQLRRVWRPKSRLAQPISRGSGAHPAPPQATLTCKLTGPALEKASTTHRPGAPTRRPSPTQATYPRTSRVSRVFPVSRG
ncbi:hypothetical protein NN561_012567 [Cricetulus griseus]